MVLLTYRICFHSGFESWKVGPWKKDLVLSIVRSLWIHITDIYRHLAPQSIYLSIYRSIFISYIYIQTYIYMNNIHTYIYIYAGCPRSFSRGGVATKNITCVKDLYTLVQVGARLHDTPRIHAHEQTKNSKYLRNCFSRMLSCDVVCWFLLVVIHFADILMSRWWYVWDICFQDRDIAVPRRRTMFDQVQIVKT